MGQRYIRDLYEHQEWADALIWSAVVARADAAKDAWIVAKLLHMHTVQRAFLQIWRTEPIAIPEVASFESAAAVAAWGRGTHAEVSLFLKTLDEEKLSHDVALPWAGQISRVIGRPPAPSCLRDTLIQVPMHSTHHRGQVATRIREAGGNPPLTDYIAWIWMGRPQPEWPGAA
ncbi:MAG: DinB family protein [Thermoanaerobaculia bacterium]